MGMLSDLAVQYDYHWLQASTSNMVSMVKEGEFSFPLKSRVINSYVNQIAHMAITASMDIVFHEPRHGLLLTAKA